MKYFKQILNFQKFLKICVSIKKTPQNFIICYGLETQQIMVLTMALKSTKLFFD